MGRMGRTQIVLVSTLGAALLASVGMNLYQFWRLAALKREVAGARQSLHELQETLRQRSTPEAPAQAGGQTPVSEYQAALARRDATIARLNREVKDAQASITDLQTQLSNAKDEREKALAVATASEVKVQADLQSQIDTLKQELNSAQDEAQASRRRASALEAENTKLRTATSTTFASAADFARAVADLQDVDRRREGHLTSMMRRYRDITNQFRAMSGMLDSSHDPNSGAFSGAALTRIQDAVSLADEDLRQLNELNAQARQLEKKLEKK